MCLFDEIHKKHPQRNFWGKPVIFALQGFGFFPDFYARQPLTSFATSCSRSIFFWGCFSLFSIWAYILSSSNIPFLNSSMILMVIMLLANWHRLRNAYMFFKKKSTVIVNRYMMKFIMDMPYPGVFELLLGCHQHIEEDGCIRQDVKKAQVAPLVAFTA